MMTEQGNVGFFEAMLKQISFMQYHAHKKREGGKITKERSYPDNTNITERIF